MTEEPTVVLDDYTTEYLLLRAKRSELKQLAREVKAMEDAFRARTGAAHVAKIGDQEVFTNRPINAFQGKLFAEENPILAKDYTKPVVKDELDVEALKRDHPAIYEKYQSRQFRILDVE